MRQVLKHVHKLFKRPKHALLLKGGLESVCIIFVYFVTPIGGGAVGHFLLRFTILATDFELELQHCPLKRFLNSLSVFLGITKTLSLFTPFLTASKMLFTHFSRRFFRFKLESEFV